MKHKLIIIFLLICQHLTSQIMTSQMLLYKITATDTTLIQEKPVVYTWTHNDKMTIIQRKSKHKDASPYVYYLQQHNYKFWPDIICAKFSTLNQLKGELCLYHQFRIITTTLQYQDFKTLTIYK